jgi:predicted PurR-regulated permease PerM
MTLITFMTLLLMGLVITLRMIVPYALALVMGGILAFLSHPLFACLRHRHFKPKIASATVTLGILLLVIVPISVFVILAIKQGIYITQGIAANDELSFQSLFNRISHWAIVEKIIGSPEVLERQIQVWVQGTGKAVTSIILGIAADVPKIALQLVLASISCFFFLVDGPKFLTWMADKIPLDLDVRTKISQSFENTAISVIWATLAAASVQSAIMLASFLILDVPAAFLAAGATFIFAWIPIVGSGPVWITGAIFLYLQGSALKAVLMITLGIITGVVDNFVRPIVLKGRGNLHPLVSLVAIFGGIGMFGLMGIFIGPILVAIVISVLQIWPIVGHRFGLLPRPDNSGQRASIKEPKESQS